MIRYSAWKNYLHQMWKNGSYRMKHFNNFKVYFCCLHLTHKITIHVVVRGLLRWGNLPWTFSTVTREFFMHCWKYKHAPPSSKIVNKPKEKDCYEAFIFNVLIYMQSPNFLSIKNFEDEIFVVLPINTFY